MTEENQSIPAAPAAAPPQEEAAQPKPAKKKKDPREKLYQPDMPLMLTASPHDYNVTTTPQIMWIVVITLLPSLVSGIYYFGLQAALVVLVSVVAAVITEVLINQLRRQELTITDGSAVLTGLLLALTLPPGLNLVSVALGSIFAIAVGKMIFGGLGYNIFNPALLGRSFLQASFPVAMTTWIYPVTEKYADIDAVSAATPLGSFKFEGQLTAWMDLITGNVGGSIGETSAIAVLIGGLFLVYKRYADWRIVVGFLGSLMLFSGALWLVDSTKYLDPVTHVLAGGALLGAFFMATDMVTSPVNPIGSWIFGIGIGFLLVIIRVFGGLPEGMMYAILLMNGFTPLINRYTRPRYLGEVRT